MSSNLFIRSHNQSVFYESGNYYYAYDKRNTFMQAVNFENTIINASETISDYEIVFLEDHFDPKFRIKRGRLFKKSATAQPVQLWQYDNDTFTKYGSNISDQFYQYEPYRISKLNMQLTKKINLYLGFADNKSKWEVVLIDSIHSKEDLITLKNVVGFRDIPILNETQIPVKFYENIEREYNNLIDELHALPESTIEHCRDVATAILLAKLEIPKGQEQDLGPLVGVFDKKYPGHLEIVKNCALIINRLHPRRKPNEYELKQLKKLTEENAEIAKLCVFTMLEELEWLR